MRRPTRQHKLIFQAKILVPLSQFRLKFKTNGLDIPFPTPAITAKFNWVSAQVMQIHWNRGLVFGSSQFCKVRLDTGVFVFVRT